MQGVRIGSDPEIIEFTKSETDLFFRFTFDKDSTYIEKYGTLLTGDKNIWNAYLEFEMYFAFLFKSTEGLSADSCPTYL